MNNTEEIIRQLQQNQTTFHSLFEGISPELQTWRLHPEHWCLLEIICHLYDEEREDFRARVKSILDDPEQPLSPFNPVAWVTERSYMTQDFEQKRQAFLEERSTSIDWLTSLTEPKWDNSFQHPKRGPLTARMFLSNWLAHDYLHIRQITRVKYEYLRQTSGLDISYAGTW